MQAHAGGWELTQVEGPREAGWTLELRPHVGPCSSVDVYETPALGQAGPEAEDPSEQSPAHPYETLR